MIAIILNIVIICLIVYKIKQGKDIEKRLNEVEKSQKDQSIMICKLMFHKAKDLEEYETCAMIKKTLPKVNMYKIFE